VERAETARIILRALGGLPAAQRELIILRDIQDLSIEEIAAILNCTRGSVGVKLHRARYLFKEKAKALLQAKE
jgi:RNA polymerase sigma factor (sigma-70 family)